MSALNSASVSQSTARSFVPSVVTKELAVANRGDKRRIVLSSNFLRMMGFDAGVRHDINPVGNMDGLNLSFNSSGRQKVYERVYQSRRNNPFETQIDIQNQAIINAGIPAYTERVHFEIRHGLIQIRPLANRTFSIRRNLFNDHAELNSFVAMTSGVDARCLLDTGFKIDSVLEYRPQEKRDKTDLTETGALNAIANVHPRLLINEDITKVSMSTIERLMQDAPPIALLHLSLQCDDFSNLKTNKAKAASVDTLDTSADLVYDGLRLIETVKPAIVMVEQVPGFAASGEGRLLAVKLRKWGYFVHEAVMTGSDFGGLTTRTRYYLVASVWPNFQMPEQAGAVAGDVWSIVDRHLDQCRDVSHTNSVAEGITTGRIRIIDPNSRTCPTITKSQNRQAKDSIYIKMGDRYLLPSVELLSELSGIPVDFNYSCVGKTIQSEIIGQSIDYPMHHRVLESIHAHIRQNVGNHSVVNISKNNICD